MSAFHLRPAKSTDAGPVGAILSEFIDTTDWMPRIHTRAEDLSFAGLMVDSGWVTVAENALGVVGFVARDQNMIHSLYVRKTHRSMGCGAALLNQMKTESAALHLWTFQANSRAQAFYLHHGFRETERSDGVGNDEGLPDIRYDWRAE